LFFIKAREGILLVSSKTSLIFSLSFCDNATLFIFFMDSLFLKFFGKNAFISYMSLNLLLKFNSKNTTSLYFKAFENVRIISPFLTFIFFKNFLFFKLGSFLSFFTTFILSNGVIFSSLESLSKGSLEGSGCSVGTEYRYFEYSFSKFVASCPKSFLHLIIPCREFLMPSSSFAITA